MSGGPARFELITRAEIDSLVTATHDDPFAVLGPHQGPHGWVVRAMVPGADRVEVVDRSTDKPITELQPFHEAGLFCAVVPALKAPDAYRFRATRGDISWAFEDPYRFGPMIGEVDEHLFSEGTHLAIYDILGARLRVHEGVEGTGFAVWAPNARRVSVVGDFNGWDGRCHVMRRRGSTGIHEIFVPGVGDGTPYKYEILGHDGTVQPLKADPIGFGSEQPPKTASVVRPVPQVDRTQDPWFAGRPARHGTNAPIAIYEAHLGSWRRAPDGGDLNYRQLADTLVPYVADLGFTHLELLPVSEHPFSGSWGYQPIGLYSPTARFGTPADFAAFISACHRAEIGLILDWVPGHFPTDAHGLALFDGTHLYEHADPRQGYHPDWNTLVYNFGRREVVNFLIANALFWLRKYGVDGLRVDAVASMLYLDYSREAGEWIPNPAGGNENLEAIAFLKRLNEIVYGDDAGVMTIAEESTAWPGVSRPTGSGGLGFGYKWNMGWMNDTLDYMSRDPIHRRYHHHQMTFSLHYAWSENFVLPLSHDEVVHGKGSILGRMPGDRWQKFANLRAYYAYMWGHPGKKLLFMGSEFGQSSEWNHDTGLPWHEAEAAEHAGVPALIRDLNAVYRSRPSMHRHDCDAQGFEWIVADAADESVFAFLRKGDDRHPPVAVISNMTSVPRQGWQIGLPRAGRWREILNTDSIAYGGSGMGNAGAVEATGTGAHGRPASASLTLPPLATLMLEYSPQ